MGSRVVDLGMYDFSTITDFIKSAIKCLTYKGCIIISENTDFSGRIEPRAGWAMKTGDSIYHLYLKDWKAQIL